MGKSDEGINPKFFWFVAQMAHMFCGSTIILSVLLFFGLHTLFYVLPVFTVVTAIKEFWYDVHYENAETRQSGLCDFGAYQVGAYVPWVLYIIFK